MQGPSRRSFYSALIQILASIMGAAFALPAAFYLLKESRVRGGVFVEIADLKSFAIRQPREVTFERARVDGWRTHREKAIAWVVRTDDNSAVAYSPQCTHLGCAYHWEDQQHNFVCPCHASMFSIEGRVVAGPATRPLDRYDVRIKSGKLLIGSQVQRPEA